ncbi:DUF2199 domain-containing protein [Silvimonas iriomotensis]|uniref:DUF2199 domain-containing protein n=1 Tax=Silvimonas iriomotensis TaxID=449662 RepID=A0ABQ2P403_9NEIS|nr:DUF2199 domain-containing protein [Silvimonas iriomotensis]GGP17678.1 hypothetical protein GCM10010970_00930 [Silvimonas iriomotensis]
MHTRYSFTCTRCGQNHVCDTGCAFEVPYHYFNLSDEQQQSIATLDTDFCTIRHAQQTDYFVHAVLEMPVHDDPSLMYSWYVWVAIDEATFKAYQDFLRGTAPAQKTVGWLANQLPGYPDTLNMAVEFHPRGNGMRPLVFFQRNPQQIAHPALQDQYGGFSVLKLRTLSEHLVHGTGLVDQPGAA